MNQPRRKQRSRRREKQAHSILPALLNILHKHQSSPLEARSPPHLMQQSALRQLTAHPTMMTKQLQTEKSDLFAALGATASSSILPSTPFHRYVSSVSAHPYRSRSTRSTAPCTIPSDRIRVPSANHQECHPLRLIVVCESEMLHNFNRTRSTAKLGTVNGSKSQGRPVGERALQNTPLRFLS